MPNLSSIYQLKVTISNIRPPIWRRLLLPSNATFWDLHIAIQDSFGWFDSHLHEFFIGAIWDWKAIHIKIPHPDDELYPEDKEPLDESKTILSDHLSEKQPSIGYVYDFGDDWQHRILLEKILSADPKEVYPQVVAGKRACPWEDSGGPWGFEDKIAILKNKKHPDHKEIAEWLFECFDLENVKNPSIDLSILK
ncbi:MAG: plasmid pRiA4b ORF-3 family protein [Candidatus Berkelbacteria bacterium]|nr:plasmid pRiA4b ORF-3 family protein [Candidatus Berkelbacteria bacterium]MCR4307355.1 plasmid pRiA4b ORF-3 family protein [Candidatus Berkelbacteria bacterium]